MHLDEPVDLERLSSRFYLSPYYFHRLFSAIVGKPLAAYVRDRRILYACEWLSKTDRTVLDIALSCGFHSAQSFSRAFAAMQGMSPSEYRRRDDQPVIMTADELVKRFTNRLQGGILLNPNIINRGGLKIAGTHGDGCKTWDVWNAFEKLVHKRPLENALSKNGYEIRLYDGDKCTVHVGFSVTSAPKNDAYSVFELPPSKYASFEVYVTNGYESENNAMDEWLKTNGEGYSEKLLNGLHYCVEYYDERFNGDDEGSIVEIWVPIEKR
ncbi:MAG: AraC family transcriptional regulator [Eubacteriales bacterium]|nr:AraC family transcriptional regulator [Eubacteriales bacterium]